MPNSDILSKSQIILLVFWKPKALFGYVNLSIKSTIASENQF